ncbi:hypothetical protein DN062_00940 [Nitrincola tibetensis]|uniref:YhdP central domain-containing protein n=1 Tax=Nitrincola tibetensis TaxID=2219697 RepID=A0A364NRG9_9GAMM|nr:AsmA-like C-terminal region-containing protein [Nitrincola tibetensis]RAU19681.1 hypothetical protein DN062_00940 [Nitrincola tibetensis]
MRMKTLVRTFSRILLGLTFTLCLLTLLARIALTLAANNEAFVFTHLSPHLSGELHSGKFEVSVWRRHPQLAITQLDWVAKEDEAVPLKRLQIGSIVAEIDLLSSLWYRSLVFKTLVLRDASVDLDIANSAYDTRQDEQPSVSENSLLAGLIRSSLAIENLALNLTLENEERQIDVLHLSAGPSDKGLALQGRMRLPHLISDDSIFEFGVHLPNLGGLPTLANEFQVYLNIEDLELERLTFLLPSIDVDDLPKTFSTQVWLSIESGQVIDAQGQLRMSDWQPRFMAQPLQVTTRFRGSVSEDEARIHLTSAEIQLQDTALGVKQLDIGLALDADSNWALRLLQLDVLDLAELNRLISSVRELPEDMDSLLSDLSPAGHLRELQLYFADLADWKSFRFSAELDQVSVSAWDEAPEARGVVGRLDASWQVGRVVLESGEFFLSFPQLFDQGWSYTHASGEIDWSWNDHAIKIGSNVLALKNDQVDARGRFSLYRPFDKTEQVELSLMIGMANSQALQAEFYTPPVIGEDLHAWLMEAIKGGSVNRAGLVIHAGLRSGAPSLPLSVQLFFDVEDARFAFLPEWPVIEDAKFFLHLRDTELRVDIEQGRLMNTQVNNAWVYMPPDAQRLFVGAPLVGDLSDITQLLKGPLGLANEVADWHFSGQATTALQLMVPLNDRDSVNVEFTGSLNSVSAASEALDLSLEAIVGELSYSSSTGFYAPKLNGQLWGQSFQASVETKNNETLIDLQSRVDMPQLTHWMAMDTLNDSVSGQTEYRASIVLCNDLDCPKVSLASNLEGIVIQAPKGLNKSAADQRPLRVEIQPENTQFRVDYNDQFSAIYNYGASPRGMLRIGSGEVNLPELQGLEIEGQVAYLDADIIDEWSTWLASELTKVSQVSNREEEKTDFPVTRLSIRVAEAIMAGQAFSNVQVAMRRILTEPSLRFQLSSDQATGNLTRDDVNQPWNLSLNELALTFKPERKAQASPSVVEPLLTERLLQRMPIIKVDIERLELNEKNIGHWRFELVPESDHLKVHQIDASLMQMSLTGQLDWFVDPTQSSRLQARLMGSELQNMLKSWSDESAIEAKSIDAIADFTWLGGAEAFKLSALNGRFAFSAEQGRIVESGMGANFLRVFGILNLNTLSRRLKLDFSDLLQKGLVFDHVTAAYSLRKGLASTMDPLKLTGPSATMTISGSLNFNDDQFDKMIEVNIPLGSNLTLGAVLLGAPQVAGAIFLVDRIMGDQIEKMTRIRYRLTGTLDEPVIQLMGQPTATSGE